MATSDQVQTLIRAHLGQDNEKFKTTVLQIAAYEARRGHMKIASDLKALLEKSPEFRAKILQLNNQNQMLLMTTPRERQGDLVASEEIHDRITRILREFKNRNKLHQRGLTNRRKILLEGDSGTGKTMTASIIASELNLLLFTVQMDKLVTKFMGETSVKLRQIFDSIESIMGVYLFDEFDARGIDNDVGEMRRVLNSFLQFLEQDLSESIIICATNNHRMLDKALFRRFDDVLHYTLPTDDEIVSLYSLKLSIASPHFVPTVALVENSRSLSHSEIARACDDAIKTSILNDTEITEKDLLKLIGERQRVYFKEAEHNKERAV